MEAKARVFPVWLRSSFSTSAKQYQGSIADAWWVCEWLKVFFSFYYNYVFNLRVTSIELCEMMQHSCSKLYQSTKLYQGYQTFFNVFFSFRLPSDALQSHQAPYIANATISIQYAPWQPTMDQGRSIPFIPFHLTPSWTTKPFRNSVYNNGDGWEKPGEGDSWVSTHHLKMHLGNPGEGFIFNLVPRVKLLMRNLRTV